MPQTQKIQLAPITAWTLVKWFLIPGLILAYITLYPPARAWYRAFGAVL